MLCLRPIDAPPRDATGKLTRSMRSAFNCTRWPWRSALSAFLIALLLALAGASAAGQESTPAPLLLADLPQGQSLVGSMGVLADPGGNLDLEQVRSAAVDARFSYPQQALRVAPDEAVRWFKITLQQTGTGGNWVLVVPSVAANDLRFFGPFDSSGQALAEPVIAGLDHPYSSRIFASERFMFRVQLPHSGVYTLYLRIASSTSQVYAMTVWDAGRLLVASQTKRLFDGVCYGILLGMLVYNLALLFVFRDRTSLYYLLSCAAALLAVAGFNGHVAHYLLGEYPPWVKFSLVALPAIWIALGALFASSFLDLARYAPRIDKLNRALSALAGGAVLLSLVGLFELAWRVVELVAVAGTVTALAGAVLALRSGFKPAVWYLYGQAALFAAVVAVVLTNRGVLQWPFVQGSGLQIGVVLETVVFAVAMASRIRLMQAQQTELKLRAVELATAAETDPLTGLANRNGLVRHATALLQGDTPLALLLLDLDHFKPINDQHGHAAGDRVLVETASRLKRQLRPGDVIARIGGDEFVVLLHQSHPSATVRAIADRLLQAIAQPITLSGVAVQVTGSLGVAMYPASGHSLSDLLRAADSAMYQIKQGQHAGVAFAG